jgi:Rrf2 family transcriptional regulator, nitric oxide-sensitive transcriptional repressor
MVTLSERVNLAFHSLGYMAYKKGDSPLSAGEIAGVLGVSESHLAKVLQRLVKSGFIHSTRGAKGGFILAKNPSQINLLQIFEAIEGPITLNKCLLGKAICDEGDCILKDLLEEIYSIVRNGLRLKTLAEFAVSIKPLFEHKKLKLATSHS